MVDVTDEAELLAQRANLRAAMRSGVLTVTHGDKSVKYRQMSDIVSALAGIDAELGLITGTPRRRVRYFSTTKGL